MYRLLFALLLFTATHTYAADYPFNDTSWWQRLVYETKPKADPKKADTTIIVVSSRTLTGNKLRFISEEKGYGGLMYFVVYTHQGKWHCLKVSELKKALSYLPDIDKDFVVYTEGMGKIFTSELERGMVMKGMYDVNVIMLDYPSITTTKKTAGNYSFARRNAKSAYEDFLPVLYKIKTTRVQGKLGKGHLSLFFHSMGNNMIREIVRKNELDALNDKKWVDNLILNAACVPRYGQKKWLKEIQFANEIYIQYNPDDRTLFWPQLLTRRQQLGRTPGADPYKKAHYVNFNPIVGEGHSYFLSLSGRPAAHPAAKEYYNTILHGRSINFDDSSMYRTSSYKETGYDIMGN